MAKDMIQFSIPYRMIYFFLKCRNHIKDNQKSPNNDALKEFYTGSEVHVSLVEALVRLIGECTSILFSGDNLLTYLGMI